MQDQWLKCRVEGDLINLHHVREINDPIYYMHTEWYRKADSKDLENAHAQEINMETLINHIEIEFADPDADGMVKKCSVFIGSRNECFQFKRKVEQGITDGKVII